MKSWFRSEHHRAWLYRVSGSVGLVLVGFGIVSGQREVLIVSAIGTVLSTGTAAVHTSTQKAPNG